MVRPSCEACHAQAQLVQPAPDPGFDRAQRQLELLRQLAVAQVADIGQADYLALAVFQLTVLDGLLRCLETRPALRRCFAASYTKGFGRYRAPGFRPDGK